MDAIRVIILLVAVDPTGAELLSELFTFEPVFSLLYVHFLRASLNNGFHGCVRQAAPEHRTVARTDV